jgi:hypothetical protein
MRILLAMVLVLSVACSKNKPAEPGKPAPEAGGEMEDLDGNGVDDREEIPLRHSDACTDAATCLDCLSSLCEWDTRAKTCVIACPDDSTCLVGDEQGSTAKATEVCTAAGL